MKLSLCHSTRSGSPASLLEPAGGHVASPDRDRLGASGREQVPFGHVVRVAVATQIVGEVHVPPIGRLFVEDDQGVEIPSVDRHRELATERTAHLDGLLERLAHEDERIAHLRRRPLDRPRDRHLGAARP